MCSRMEQSVVEAAGLSKRYGQVQALDGLSLKIPPGISGILGPNGAGKTTLLKVLLGLVRADAGEAQVLGFDVRRDSLEIRRNSGVLHERPFYPKDLTVSEYLRKVSLLYDECIDTEEVLSAVGLTNASERPIHALSAGMYQRLGIAQAMIGRPKLVFLDEPTSNLDVIGRDQILNMILETYNQSHVSFIISSHILSEVERLCHYVAFVRNGQVIESGTVKDIIDARTSRRYRVSLSDPASLLGQMESLDSVSTARVDGAHSISITIDSGEMQHVEMEIRQIAQQMGIEIYGFVRACTLEDAFREVMTNDNSNS